MRHSRIWKPYRNAHRALIRCCVIAMIFGGSDVNAQDSLRALDPTKELSQFTWQSWQKKHGLPQNSVHTILQARDGYLWLGTEEGLVRFDGVRFRVYNPRNTKALKKRFVTTLAEQSDGTIWIGTNGGGVGALRKGKWSHYPLDIGARINVITEDRRGTLWVGSQEGLYRLSDSLFVPVLQTGVTVASDGPEGGLLLGTLEGLFLLRPGEDQPIRLFGQTIGRVGAIVAENGGTLWIGTRAGLYRIRGKSLTRFSTMDGLPSDVISALRIDARGTLWVGTDGSGFCRIMNGTVSVYGEDDPFESEHVHSLATDFEGNLWVGTGGSGLIRISNSTFSTFRVGTSASQNMVRTVYTDQSGALLVGNQAGEVLRWNGKRFEISVRLPGNQGYQVRALARDPNGTLWIGTNAGLYVYENGRLSSPLDLGSTISSLWFGHDGILWVGTSRGLAGVRTPRNQRRIVARHLSGHAVRYVKQTSSGLLYASSVSGLYALSDSVIVHYHTGNGLRSNGLYSLVLTDDETLWAGSSDGGLVRIKSGKITTIGSDEGLFDENVYEILDDGHGYFWMSCNNGVFRASKKALEDFAEGRISRIVSQPFGESDGMLSSECNGGNQSAAARTPDGRLWFATIAGVAMVDPARLSITSTPPPLAIEGVYSGQVEIPLQEEIVFQPDQRDVGIDFTAMAFSAPSRVRFRYKLVGYNQDWVDATDRRWAFYSNLDPGVYTFQVTAANADGPWNTDGASVTIELRPAFYETGWFMGLCVAAGLLALGRILQLYRRYQQRKLAALQLESELSKAQLHALRLQLQPHFLFNTLNAISGTILVSRDKGIKMIAKLSEFLRQTLDTDSAQVLSLRKELTLLKPYLDLERERFGKRLSITIDTAEDTLDAMVPSFILQPLVENAIHHGISRNVGRGTILIQSRRQGSALELVVTDNGRGTNGSLRDGIGISNTRSRLQRLYGSASDFTLLRNEAGGMTSRIVLPFSPNDGAS